MNNKAAKAFIEQQTAFLENRVEQNKKLVAELEQQIKADEDGIAARKEITEYKRAK